MDLFKNKIVLILITISILLLFADVFLLWRVKEVEREATILKDLNGQPINEGVVRKSSLDKEWFDITGTVLRSPYKENGEYYLDISIGGEIADKQITVRLGRPDYVLSVNLAEQGVQSGKYILKEVDEVVDLIKKFDPIQVRIVTKDNSPIKPPKEKCDDSCEANLESLEKYGQETSEVLSNFSDVRNGYIIRIPVNGLIIAVF